MEKLEALHTTEGRRFLFAVETTAEAAAYHMYEELRQEIWGDPVDHLSGVRNLASENFFQKGSSLFIAVYHEEPGKGIIRDKQHLAAFAYGYVGVRDKTIAYRDPANLIFYSQYVAVRPDLQNSGLGVMLKKFQGEMVHEVMGVGIITCTFDPLVGINAYRNLHTFAMKVLDYKDACYAGFAGKLNRADVPSDRLYVSWDLRESRSPLKYDLPSLLAEGCNIVTAEIIPVRGKNGRLSLEVIRNIALPTAADVVLLEIPYDFYTMLRETDVPDPEVRKIPLDWRLQTRRAFHELSSCGYKVRDFRYLRDASRTRDFYIWKKLKNNNY